MRICDAHLHYGLRDQVEKIIEVSLVAKEFPCYNMVQIKTMDGYEKQFAEHCVDRTVLVPFVFREQSAREENALVLEYARQDPLRRFPYALLDESDPDFLGRHFRDFVGVKEHVVRSKSQLTESKKVIFEQLRDHNMTLLIHSERIRREAYLLAVLENFPGIKIQIAHMGRGLPGDTQMICRMLEVFRPYETVTFDTSTTREPWVVERAVQTVGAERILYGSDLPFYIDSPDEDIMDAQIRQILNADITDDQREAIFCKNFVHWIQRGV